MSGKIISYESLDGRMVPEALTRNNALGLNIVDGHAVKNPGDYEEPDQLFDMLIARIRRYHPTKDVSKVEAAYEVAKVAHGHRWSFACGAWFAGCLQDRQKVVLIFFIR